MKIWPTHCKACGQAIERDDNVCAACGAELSQEPFESDAVHATPIALPSFAGYADLPLEKNRAPRKKSNLPVLEILVAVLLVTGAVTAIWILRATIPRTGEPVVSVTITPDNARVVTGKSLELAATVSGARATDVNWTIEEGGAGGRVVDRGAKADGGKVSSFALYTAPRKPGTYHVVAASREDPAKSATATITVVKR